MSEGSLEPTPRRLERARREGDFGASGAIGSALFQEAKIAVVARRERLFEQVDVQFGHQPLQAAHFGDRPAFVRIDDHPRVRCGGANGDQLAGLT